LQGPFGTGGSEVGVGVHAVGGLVGSATLRLVAAVGQVVVCVLVTTIVEVSVVTDEHVMLVTDVGAVGQETFIHEPGSVKLHNSKKLMLNLIKNQLNIMQKGGFR
jgi:hypothetical protein